MPQILFPGELAAGGSGGSSGGTATQTPAGPINRVYLVYGQSNAVGSEPLANFADQYRAPFTRTYVQTGSNDPSWSLLTPGTNQRGFASGNSAGIDLSLAHALEAAYPNDNIYLLCLGWGGTSLYKDWDPVGGFFWMSMAVEAAAALKILPPRSYMCGLCWNQGEGDESEPAEAARYKANLLDHITAIRRFFGDPNLPFIASRLDYGTHGVRAAVEAMKTDGETLNFDWVDQDGFNKVDSGLHFQADGLEAIGLRYAEKLIGYDYRGEVRRTWPIRTATTYAHRAVNGVTQIIGLPVRNGRILETSVTYRCNVFNGPTETFFDAMVEDMAGQQFVLINNQRWSVSAENEEFSAVYPPIASLALKNDRKYMRFRFLRISGENQTMSGIIHMNIESYD